MVSCRDKLLDGHLTPGAIVIENCDRQAGFAIRDVMEDSLVFTKRVSQARKNRKLQGLRYQTSVANAMADESQT